jgi:hypothetical protein
VWTNFTVAEDKAPRELEETGKDVLSEHGILTWLGYFAAVGQPLLKRVGYEASI